MRNSKNGGKKSCKKSGTFGKISVAIIIFIVVYFTHLFIYSFIRVGSEPVVLEGLFYAWASCELIILLLVKKDKIKQLSFLKRLKKDTEVEKPTDDFDNPV